MVFGLLDLVVRVPDNSSPLVPVVFARSTCTRPTSSYYTLIGLKVSSTPLLCAASPAERGLPLYLSPCSVGFVVFAIERTHSATRGEVRVLLSIAFRSL